MDESPSRPSDRELESAILELLAKRAGSATICPSEAARAVGGDDWRDQMDAARSAARRLEAAGVVDITQRGEVVDPATARGPIRIRSRATDVDTGLLSVPRSLDAASSVWPQNTLRGSPPTSEARQTCGRHGSRSWEASD